MSELPLLTLLTVAGAVVALGVLLVAVVVLSDPRGVARRVEAAFRRPPGPPKTVGDEHYYRPYWSR